MAKNKSNQNPPQAQHGKRSSPSQHDRRSRLTKPNGKRRRTEQAQVPLRGAMADVANSMSRVLDSRISFRFPIIVAGMMLASGRRTASSWFRAAGVKDDWDCFYDMLTSIGKRVADLMLPLLLNICKRFDPGPDGHWTLAIDDSPTKRFGRKVEAANIHHNPTPGPGDSEWLYGHSWVSLAIIARHVAFGTIALPVLSMLYVRQDDSDEVEAKYGWKFKTKHVLALSLCRRVMRGLRAAGSLARFVVVFDGAYASRSLILPLLAEGATLVTRIRCDAKLFDIPKPEPGKRGRPRKYGKNRISLKIRAGRRDGWETVKYLSRGFEAEGKIKTFLATSGVFGGAIRVVLLQHASGNWAAYASSDLSMDAEAILKIVSDRWAIEEHFHDVKEIWGASQQQIRRLHSSVACWQLCGWLYTMVELACWDREAASLVDRSDRPWDNPKRRPSHADRRRQLTREMLRESFLKDLTLAADKSKIQLRFEQVLALAT